MECQPLEWDSNFFGLRVAKITVNASLSPAELHECLMHADVTYVFLVPEIVPLYQPVLDRMGGKCYDHKITFERVINPVFATQAPAIFEITEESESLLQLAYASGHLSRFFLDPRFKPHFKRLYAEWIRKTLRDPDAKVFAVTNDQGEMQGMLTASVNANGVGQIGLVAIDAASRGQGLALRLMKHCESYYVARGARACRVVTQKDNLAACRLYQKSGYVVASEHHIWHIWK